MSITKILLEKGANYVLTGTFQSDRLESEFGRQQSRVNQINNSLCLQRIKLYRDLQLESPVVHEKQAYCIEPFEETDLQYLNSCFETTASLTTLERSALYYINVLTNILDSEFTTLVSRGKLRHPPNYMYDLYCIYTHIIN